ncbi:hypothetical protein E3O25_08830 [Cryobacterium sp. TMT1-3]|uniref:Uncharacterized protein n=1 Tax=Cryobacterium luteum TaxID=1424661 RepID=A0A1H8JYB9_9MICO|nr:MULTISPECIES: hypothetical protein [Cryobacterium]TFB81980.1 hypothetical protein E3O10_17945 [Cryobacterium luteum]TFC28241.1 hypothetical protein E3O25_08830 [Cryobacterium sp. TMT1-3]SEN85208.1 hypothetical protein SAMN05216281_11649 [Cryobacterium luteum]
MLGVGYFLPVRWDDLFDDLEGQLDRALSSAAADLSLQAERQRLEKLSLRTRISNVLRSAGVGGALQIRVVLVTGETLTLRPTTLGLDWLAADLPGAANNPVECVIPLSAVAGVLLTEQQSQASLAIESEAAGRQTERVGFPFVLSSLCRRRRTVELHTKGGVLIGTIDRVARDHLDLAVHPLGTLRRTPDVLHYNLVPFWQIHIVRLH